MNIKLQAQWVIGSKDSIIASSEKKDCVVYAVASSFDLDYDTAHEKVRSIFDRPDRKGTKTSNIVSKMKDMVATKELINGKYVKEVIDQPTKTYHTYGKDVKRKNRVSTFIKEHTQGTYLILTSGHALTIKDGAMIDNITKGSGSKLITKAFKVEKVEG